MEIHSTKHPKFAAMINEAAAKGLMNKDGTLNVKALGPKGRLLYGVSGALKEMLAEWHIGAIKGVVLDKMRGVGKLEEAENVVLLCQNVNLLDAIEVRRFYEKKTQQYREYKLWLEVSKYLGKASEQMVANIVLYQYMKEDRALVDHEYFYLDIRSNYPSAMKGLLEKYPWFDPYKGRKGDAQYDVEYNYKLKKAELTGFMLTDETVVTINQIVEDANELSEVKPWGFWALARDESLDP